MRTETRNRLLASILIDSDVERIPMPSRRRVTAGSLVSLAVATAAAMGLVMLLLSKLHVVLR